uniref:NADH-ubiquinone oxidoreductase chain 2 n=1 Tax=Trigonopterus daun TaxID=2896816 RepID=A0A7H1KI31_9CUCU|nr:NADH dehydrogenase subunit 2 [Trigonopterus daun]
MMNFYKILFMNVLIFSTMISISSLSWISAWIGLEMNLLAIIPLMKMHSNKLSAEASIKYFIIQAMASSCLLFSVILSASATFIDLESASASAILTSSALILKMGAAPLHFWLPEVVSGLSWGVTFIILTWQKIAPMVLLSYNLQSPTIFLPLIIILSSFFSGIQGMSQVCLRKIMAFSSINHMGWMLSALMSSTTLWIYYFSVYALMNMNILIMFNKFHMFYINQLNKMTTYNKGLKFFFMLNFLSLGGLPPFIGFLPKWLTINSLVSTSHLTLSIILVTLTLMTLFLYVRITFPTITLSTSESLISPKPSPLSLWQYFSSLLVLLGLPLTFLLSSNL